MASDNRDGLEKDYVRLDATGQIASSMSRRDFALIVRNPPNHDHLTCTAVVAGLRSTLGGTLADTQGYAGREREVVSRMTRRFWLRTEQGLAPRGSDPIGRPQTPSRACSAFWI